MAGNSIGNAVVTVLPKLEKSGLSTMESDLGKAGDSGGNKLTTGISGAFKKLAALGIAAEAGKFLGDTFMRSFQESARFEQLSGGVEKIFDTMDTSRIFEDARAAYKTLNMSANDYLEIINDVGASFSATMGDSKGYDVAKQGLQAIADYSSGTGKNLDVLKEKFGMITRSTSSYQSIADQFSGILPATSKDFLEQAQAAGFLSDSYQKLTDVPIDEYQAAVAAMLEKGTQDLGLYGNTAAETEGTVSGSLAGMQAAWENLLVAMGTGENVSETAQQVVDSFIDVLGNIIPLAGQIMLGLLTAIVSALGDMIAQGVVILAQGTLDFIQNVQNAATGMVDTILTNVGNFLAAVGSFIQGGVNAVISGAVGFINGIRTMVQNGVSAVGGFVGQFTSAARNLIQGMVNGLSPSAVIEKIKSICSQAVGAIKSFFGIASPSKLMRKMFGYVGDGMVLGLTDSEGEVDRAMDSLLDSAYGKAADFGIGLNASVSGKAGAGTYNFNGITINAQDRSMDEVFDELIAYANRSRVMMGVR